MDVKTWWGKTKGKTSTDSRAALAEANQRFVRETLARREPQYARTVERVAEAVIRDMVQRRPAAQDATLAERVARAARARGALAPA